MMSSTIIPRAKPPEKHMPTAPTPGPPTSRWRLRASARNQAITGDVCPTAHVVNSLATQTLTAEAPIARPVGPAPGRPTSDGMTTVKPRATTSLAKRATSGVMLGISWMTITPGPVPRRNVSWVMPAAENSPRSQPARTVAGSATEAMGCESASRRRGHRRRMAASADSARFSVPSLNPSRISWLRSWLPIAPCR